MQWNKNWTKGLIIIIVLISIVLIGTLVLGNSFSKPNKETIINILVDDGIKINGSDSNIISPTTNREPDNVSIIFKKEEIRKIDIIESGFDRINKKYFCIFNIDAYDAEHYSLNAKTIMLLHYDKGWKLSESIGVLSANFEADKYIK